MPALNFQARFAAAVERGDKRQTIRKRRKDGRDPKSGDTLYLYTGMRTKACRKLGEVKCRTVQWIHIGKFDGERTGFPEVSSLVDGSPVWAPDFCRDPLAAERRFARRDGFRTWQERSDWFEATHGLPFEGILIRW